MSRIKLFTHTDLDGVGCAIVALHTFGDRIDIEYCDYHDVNQKIADFLSAGITDNYEFIYITDISVNEEVADRLSEFSGKVMLLDHHPTALWLNRYSWAFVETDSPHGGKRSGTEMFFFETLRYPSERFDLASFTETVRRYDTWEWSTVYNDDSARELNDLLYIIGRDRFVRRFTDSLSIEFTDTERLLLQLDSEKAREYTESKKRELIIRKIGGHFIGIVFAERYYSELSNRLPFEYPNVDFIAIINPSRSVSYRGLDKVDVGLFAKQYEGGGHKNAAGSPITPAMRDDIIDAIFKEAQYDAN
ncbi:hypothetical protein LOZ80_15275 [Paenibacillus sp. HWE-109]|uniref:DHH family phosphoesterase n=1 Tax=Paenibacillus sp. HWE-109 TaxID=1306526 RepID=UPI001EDE5E08|nr:hypothetical protein [Paenibacillus sp. HWE-109]UKS30221.1 hypothetical protein LOZ80_15275 [Paenibacillus sp. HWE-109]